MHVILKLMFLCFQFYLQKPLLETIFIMRSKYVNVRELGEGAFGNVYVTKEKKTEEEFAMKIFKAVSRICSVLL